VYDIGVILTFNRMELLATDSFIILWWEEQRYSGCGIRPRQAQIGLSGAPGEFPVGRSVLLARRAVLSWDWVECLPYIGCSQSSQIIFSQPHNKNLLEMCERKKKRETKKRDISNAMIGALWK